MKHAVSLPALALAILASTLAACQSSAPPTAAEIEATAMQARQAGDKQAERRVRNWAAKGMPVAERELARVYQPRPARRDDALRLFEQAARTGDAEAAFELGQMLRPGAPEQAWSWYRLAAQQQHARAALMMGLLAASGQGVSKDAATAAHWLEVSSELGNPQAMFLLYKAYREGRGVEQDAARSQQLLEEAAHRHYPPAIEELAMTVQIEDATRAGDLLKEASEHRQNHWNHF